MNKTDSKKLKRYILDRCEEDLDTGCWEWTGSFHYKGYGIVRCALGRGKFAHRVSWEVYNGEIPNNLFVCHKCDIRKCVNPDHLFLGTAQDNVDDMMKKGRARNGSKINKKLETFKGINNPRAILDENDILNIRQDARTLKEIARDYAVSFGLISLIKLRKIWRHVE